MSVSAANVRRRLTKDSVGELMHGPPKPKFLYDHHAANLRKLGELARDVSARREEEAAPAPQPFKLSRFAHVESRLAQTGVRCWARGARGRATECAQSRGPRATPHRARVLADPSLLSFSALPAAPYLTAPLPRPRALSHPLHATPLAPSIRSLAPGHDALAAEAAGRPAGLRRGLGPDALAGRRQRRGWRGGRGRGGI